LDLDELTRGLASFNIFITKRQCRELFYSDDADGSGDINFIEVCAVWAHVNIAIVVLVLIVQLFLPSSDSS